MKFEALLIRAQSGDTQAEEEILNLYKPLLMKQAILDGNFNEDLYQELCIVAINCIRKFRF